MAVLLAALLTYFVAQRVVHARWPIILTYQLFFVVATRVFLIFRLITSSYSTATSYVPTVYGTSFVKVVYTFTKISLCF